MALRSLLIVSLLIILTSSSYQTELSSLESGLKEFEQGDFQEAAKYFKSSLDGSPQSIEPRFYYALTLYNLDQFGEARKEFKVILDKEKRSDWGNAAKDYIEAIDLGIFAPQKEKDYQGYFNVSYDSDDNISYGPSLIAEGSDNRTSSQLTLSYQPLVGIYRPIVLSANISGTFYDKNPAYDMGGGSGDLTLNSPPLWGTYTSLYFNRGAYSLDKDPYYTSDYTEARFTFDIFPADQDWTTVYFGGGNSHYESASYEAYDNLNNTFGVRQSLNALIFIQYENKFSDTRSNDFANRSDEYTLGATAPFPFMHKLDISMKYANKSFLNDDSVGMALRHDTSHTFDLLFSRYIFIRDLSLGIRYTYTAYSSNLDRSQTALGYGSYLDHVLSLSISYKF